MHHTTEQAVAFVEQRIAEEASSTRPLRGPYLAQLELIRRLSSRGCSEEHTFGKGCCDKLVELSLAGENGGTDALFSVVRFLAADANSAQGWQKSPPVVFREMSAFCLSP